MRVVGKPSLIPRDEENSSWKGVRGCGGGGRSSGCPWVEQMRDYSYVHLRKWENLEGRLSFPNQHPGITRHSFLHSGTFFRALSMAASVLESGIKRPLYYLSLRDLPQVIRTPVPHRGALAQPATLPTAHQILLRILRFVPTSLLPILSTPKAVLPHFLRTLLHGF